MKETALRTLALMARCLPLFVLVTLTGQCAAGDTSSGENPAQVEPLIPGAHLDQARLPASTPHGSRASRAAGRPLQNIPNLLRNDELTQISPHSPPLADIFTGSYRSVLQSKVSYMAQHVAREMQEELRSVPFSTVEGRSHDWRAVSGHVLRGSDCRSAVDRADGSLLYPPSYGRIETRLAIAPLYDRSGRKEAFLKKAIIEVRWQEKGSAGLRQR